MLILTLSVLICLLAPNVCIGDTPNHLEPIPAYSYYQGVVEYRQLVYRTLIQDRQPKAWMLVKPSFSPEYAVILDGPARSANPDDTTSIFFTVEYVVAKQKIWGYKKLDGGKMELDLKHDVRIERREARVPVEIGEEIMTAWTALVLKTRRAYNKDIVLDGVTYEFCVSDGWWAQTWSPKSGVPKMMVDSGELLIKYVTAKGKKRDKILKRLLTLCDGLQATND